MALKTTITAKDTQRYWHDIRLERQKEIRKIVDECHRLRSQHKQIFDGQGKSPTKQRFLPKRYPPRIVQNDLPVVTDGIDYSGESPSIVGDEPMPRLSSSRKKSSQRCPSVSSVTSNEKRTNRVYEQWPDYTEISRIVGYPIQKPPPPRLPSPIPEPPPEAVKGKKSLRFIKAVKQIQQLSLLEKPPSPPPPPPPPIILPPPIPVKLVPQLPPLLCPSSISYSKRLQTRQWLINNHSARQSLPLI